MKNYKSLRSVEEQPGDIVKNADGDLFRVVQLNEFSRTYVALTEEELEIELSEVGE